MCFDSHICGVFTCNMWLSTGHSFSITCQTILFENIWIYMKMIWIQKGKRWKKGLDNRYLPSSRKVNRPICGKSLKDSRQINPPFTSIRAIAIWSCRTNLGLIWVFSPVFLSIIHNNPLIVISSAHACKCNTALYPAHMIDLCSIITIWNNMLIHFKHYRIDIIIHILYDSKNYGSFGWSCFTPLSTIFQLGQFYWWRKQEYPEKTTDLLQVTDKHITYVITRTPPHEQGLNSQR